MPTIILVSLQKVCLKLYGTLQPMWLLDHNLPRQLVGSLESVGIACDTTAHQGRSRRTSMTFGAKPDTLIQLAAVGSTIQA